MKEMQQKTIPIVAFSQLRSIAEAKDQRLSSFFDEIEEAASVGGKDVNELKETIS